MTSTELIRLKKDNGIFQISINRPEKKNALTSAMYESIFNALEELDNDDRLRVGFITGTMDCFTSGNDLKDFMLNPPQDGSAPVMKFLNKLPKVKKPLVAAVNGPAVGVGTTMLLHCELVYAARDALFQMPFVNLGLCPEAGSSLLLPQVAVYQKAAELLMLGDSFTAEDARDIGIVNGIFDNHDYQSKAYEKAERLAKQPPASIRVTKELMRKANKKIITEVMNEESMRFANMLGGEEAMEAIQAFMEKRKPDFSRFK